MKLSTITLEMTVHWAPFWKFDYKTKKLKAHSSNYLSLLFFLTDLNNPQSENNQILLNTKAIKPVTDNVLRRFCNRQIDQLTYMGAVNYYTSDSFSN